MPKISISSINLELSTQSRAGINESAVADYRELLKADPNNLPPITVFRVKGTEVFFMADGWHRLQAHTEEGFTHIQAEIKPGDVRDAMLYAVGANAEHGLRRTNADKRHAVELLLKDKEWSQWSDREIAKRCAVSHAFVGELRSVTGNVTSEDGRKYTTKHGTDAVMKPRAAASMVASPPPPPDDEDGPPVNNPAIVKALYSAVGSPPPDDDDTVASHSNDPDPAQPQHLPKGVEIFQQLHTRIHQLKNEVAALADTPLGSAIRIEQVAVDLANAARAVRWAAPFKDCPMQPNCKTGCQTCKGQGWITEEVWKRLPKEMQ